MEISLCMIHCRIALSATEVSTGVHGHSMGLNEDLGLKCMVGTLLQVQNVVSVGPFHDVVRMVTM